MRKLVRVVGVVCLLFGVSAEATRSRERRGARCEEAVAHELALTRLWAGETVDPGFSDVADLNGVVVFEIAEFFKAKKRLPLATELPAKLKKHRPVRGAAGPAARESSDEAEPVANHLETAIEDFANYFAIPGAAKDMRQLLAVAMKELPDRFAPVKQAVQKHLMSHFRHHLRLPSLAELATESKMPLEDLTLLVGDPDQFWKETRDQFAKEYDAAVRKLTTAFIRAMAQRDRPTYLRTQSSTPSLAEILDALVRATENGDIKVDYARGLFTEAHLRALLALPASETVPAPVGADFTLPVLFGGGIAQVEEEARAQSPTSFRNYFSEVTFTPKRAEKAREAIEKADGFIVTSVNAGMPMNEAQLSLMIKYSEDTGYPIIVMPVNQVLEGLDQRLLDHPRIHVLTNTIENPALRLWQIPIMAKNQNPFASLDQRGQVEHGQVVIVGHPQQAHSLVPTGVNHVAHTQLWSPGSLSLPLYPYLHPVQGRTSALAKNYHKNGFLVVQKADRRSGIAGRGVRNFWHVRNVEVIDDREQGGRVAFTDMGRRYSMRTDDTIEIDRQDPRTLVAGDLHDWIQDRRMMLSYLDMLQRFEGIREFVIHDIIEGKGYSPHESERTGAMVRAFESGELNMHREHMGAVQTVNAVLRLNRRIRVVVPRANHNEWPIRLLNMNPMPQTQLAINGRYLAELRNARDVYGFEDPMAYIFGWRQRYLDSLPPAVRAQYEEEAIPVLDPNRVYVLPFGRTYITGPEHRTVHLNHHGHLGANGARGSRRAHASGNNAAIVGDSHQPGIWGDLTVVGYSGPLKGPNGAFQDGGYQSWANAYATSYPDGTRQLLTYASATGTYEQRAGVGPLPPEEFFGDLPLRVLPTDNQLLPDQQVMDTHSMWVNLFRKRFQTAFDIDIEGE